MSRYPSWRLRRRTRQITLGDGRTTVTRASNKRVPHFFYRAVRPYSSAFVVVSVVRSALSPSSARSLSAVSGAGRAGAGGLNFEFSTKTSRGAAAAQRARPILSPLPRRASFCRKSSPTQSGNAVMGRIGGCYSLHLGMNRFREVATNCEKAKKRHWKLRRHLPLRGREQRRKE